MLHARQVTRRKRVIFAFPLRYMQKPALGWSQGRGGGDLHSGRAVLFFRACLQEGRVESGDMHLYISHDDSMKAVCMRLLYRSSVLHSDQPNTSQSSDHPISNCLALFIASMYNLLSNLLEADLLILLIVDHLIPHPRSTWR